MKNTSLNRRMILVALKPRIGGIYKSELSVCCHPGCERSGFPYKVTDARDPWKNIDWKGSLYGLSVLFKSALKTNQRANTMAATRSSRECGNDSVPSGLFFDNREIILYPTTYIDVNRPSTERLRPEWEESGFLVYTFLLRISSASTVTTAWSVETEPLEMIKSRLMR